MHIPEKYRDRYDRLALAHPWMREMRDETETIGDLIEQCKEKIEERNYLIAKARNSFKSLAESNYDYAKFRKACRKATEIMDGEMGRMGIATDGRTLEGADEPTNGIADETNGIHEDAPLVDRDPVEIMRKAAKGFSGGTGTVMGNAKMLLGMNVKSSMNSVVLNTLADMVERDYVRRDDFNKMRERHRKEHVYWHNEMHAVLDTLNGKERFWGACMEYPLGEDTLSPSDIAKQTLERNHVPRKQWAEAVSAMKAAQDRMEQARNERDEAMEIRDKALGDAATLKVERDKAQANCYVLNAQVGELRTVERGLRDERDELTKAVNELQKKQPYCYDPDKPIETLGTIGRYIDELKAERDEWKAKALDYEHRLNVEFACSDKSIIEALESHNRELAKERDEWKAKAEQAERAMNRAAGRWARADARSRKRAEAVKRLRNSVGARFRPDAAIVAIVGRRIGQVDWSLECDALIDLLTDDDGVARSNDGVTNLEWLYEHDESFAYGARRFVVDDGYSCCETLDQAHEWLMALHANDDSTPENDVSADDMDANDANATCNNSGENVTHDSREKINALRAHYGAGPTSMTDEQIEAGHEVYGAKKDADMVIVDELHDSREKLEADAKTLLFDFGGYCAISREGLADDVDIFIGDLTDLLSRQEAITERELCAKCEWPSLAAQPDQEAYDRIAELTAKVDEQSELIAARGKTIESLERFMSERKLKLKKQLEEKNGYAKKLKAERDQYRELYEAAMTTDYAQVARERDEMSGQIDKIRSIIDETPHDGQSD